MTKRFLGVTVTPPYIQTEGVNAVLDALAAAGVNAVATAPGISEPIEALEGVDDAGSGMEEARREPPVDGGAGSVRVVDRKVFGKEEVLLRFSPSYEPKFDAYRGLKYQPKAADELTRREGKVIREFIEGAHARGMRAYFQLSAVQLYGLRDEDRPLLPNGAPPRARMVNTASVASDDVRAYVCAQLEDLLASYPDIDGFRHDWPEYPPYQLGDAFLDFGPNAERAAPQLGFDFERMRRSADRLYQRLSRLGNADLLGFQTPRGAAVEAVRALALEPALAEAFRFKSALTVRYVRELRDMLDRIPGGRDKELSPNAFPPPWSLLSGMDFGRVAEYADSINMKLYTMHWPLMVWFYASELIEQNHGLDETLLVRTISNLFDMEDDGQGVCLQDYVYPPPDKAHRAGVEAQRRKVSQALSACAGKARLYPVVHGYGPADNFAERLHTGWETEAPGIWVNRYCYLSERKLAAIAALDHER